MADTNSIAEVAPKGRGGRRTANLEGQRFGRLLILGRAPSHTPRIVYWHTVCDCGVSGPKGAAQLREGKTRSCGCLNSEMAAARKLTHGYARRGAVTQEFRIWAKINERCYDENCRQYPSYGGRGIYVCDRWRASFPNFLADMGARPSKKYSIDRIDNNGSYSPDNCRWATASQQVRNRRCTVLNEEIVRKIRAERSAGALLRELATRYKCSVGAISCVAHGRTWADVR